jgi:tetratricopeptide (TPR) repeat protein
MLSQLERQEEAEVAYRRSTLLNPNNSEVWIRLGNLLLDCLGDPKRAIEAYGMGLATASERSSLAALHGNSAYALVLHAGNEVDARKHLQLALGYLNDPSSASSHLLHALECLLDAPAEPWPGIFEHIGKAAQSGDSGLLSANLEELQRLLWFVIARGQGSILRSWTEREEFPEKFAPLYYAVVAAIDGEDHLLQINPETRRPAAQIYQGLARMLKVYKRNTRK